MQTCELLAPAGSFDALRAAVQSGANAVYFGAADFNARKNAENFGGSMREAVAYCHARNVRTFITLNTMVRQDEIDRLVKTIEETANSGADGVIVSDLGTAEIIRTMVPDIELHASTQMAVHNVSGVEYLAKQGFKRVVLAREMSFREIRECTKIGVDLEGFIHGALCVSCSGQCLLSSMVGGRSGNRGLCAQPCRMAYTTNGKEAYYLSTRDLCSLNTLPELVNMGVASLKMEGRLKRPEYVALTTRIYRTALDAIYAGQDYEAAALQSELAQMFNRGGFTDGYGPGIDESKIMFSQRPNHMGVRVGHSFKNGCVSTDLEIDSGDALVLRRLNKDIPIRQSVSGTGKIQIAEARSGDELYRLVSKEQMRREHRCIENEPLKFPVSLRCGLHMEKPSYLEMSDGHHTVYSNGDMPQPAKSGKTDTERLKAQLSKLGDTVFYANDISLDADDGIFIPVSSINSLRRSCTDQLLKLREGKTHLCNVFSPATNSSYHGSKTRLIVQSADPSVLQRALSAGAGEVAWRPEDLRSESLLHSLEMLPERFALVLPPVMTEDTLRFLNTFANENAGRISHTYISNIGQMNLSWPGILVGDYHLNVANNHTIAFLHDRGIDSVTPSVELNCKSIRALDGAKELIVYGRLPLMELRHCPYRNTHKLKGDHNSCRRCDHAANGERLIDLTLTDRVGAEFHLKRIAADTGCIIELLNSATLMLLRKHRSLPECDAWRLMIESDEPVETIVGLHRAALAGNPDPDPESLSMFKNTTTGHYFRGAL